MIRQWGWPPVKDAPKLAANQSGAGESGRWFTRMASQNEAAWAGRARHEEENWRYCELILTRSFYRYVLPQPSGPSMLTVLGGLAEFERTLIAARTGEGRKRAKDRGVRFGRPRKMTAHQRQEALRRLAAGETVADVARTFNVDATTIGRLAASSPFERAVVVR